MSAGKVYVVLVTGKLKPGQIEKFQELFRPLAQYVEASEQGAHTYQFSVGADDGDKLLIYERYVSQEFLETVHWISPAFKEFQAKCQEAAIEWVEKSIVKYHETDIGFVTRKA